MAAYEIQLPDTSGTFTIVHDTQGIIAVLTVEEVGDEEFIAEIVLVDQ